MIKRYFFPALLLLVFVVLPVAALAQTSSGGNTPPTSSGGNTPPTSSGGNTLPVTSPVSSGGSYKVDNPLGANSFCGLIKNLLQAAIAIGIPIAVLFIVYAGFKFVLAQGKPDALKEARKNFMWTLIGIAIFLGAWLLANVIANTVTALGGQQNIISCN